MIYESKVGSHHLHHSCDWEQIHQQSIQNSWCSSRIRLWSNWNLPLAWTSTMTGSSLHSRNSFLCFLALTFKLTFLHSHWHSWSAIVLDFSSSSCFFFLFKKLITGQVWWHFWCFMITFFEALVWDKWVSNPTQDKWTKTSFQEEDYPLMSQAYHLISHAYPSMNQAYPWWVRLILRSINSISHHSYRVIQCLLLEFQPGSIKWVSNIVSSSRRSWNFLNISSSNSCSKALCASCDAFAQLTGLKSQHLIAGLCGMNGKEGNNYFPWKTWRFLN